jgi:glycine/D-amino acid oxidase-like deaminating enzyme
MILVMWDYRTHSMQPSFPPPFDPWYPDIALRGLVRMIPAMRAYLDRMPKPAVDGGYYTRTRENRPLIGPLPVRGAYVIGAFSGFGMMASCGAGELLAAHVTGSPLPHYAPAFSFERYQDPEYQTLLENWPNTGQL